MPSFLTLLFFLIATIPAITQTNTNNRLLFVANLDGDQEAPAVATNARGVATFLFSDDRTAISIHGVFTGLSGPITGCHVHSGVEGVSGPVYTNFSGNITGNRLRADIVVPDGFLSKALKNEMYLNVHTAAHPGGEIRGQLVLMTDVQYVAVLNGLEEVPPVLTTATGVYRFTYSPGNSKGSYFGSYHGLSGSPTAAHIHNGPIGVGGPVVVGLSSGVTGAYAGDLDFAALPADFLQKLEDNQLYVNVHTSANPGGEIRGQLRSLGPITFEATLNGDQETPPVATSAIGTAVAVLSPNMDSLTYYVSATGLTPTAAHFHTGAPGVGGSVAVGLTASLAPNFYTAKIPVNSTFINNLLNGDIYVNIHTAANPGGEIRGQMESNLRRVYAFDLCGEQEVPPNSSTAQGAAAVTTDRLNTNLNYLFIADGLTGPATAAHIHDGAAGVGGPVYLPVNTPAPVGSGQFPITGANAVKLESGSTYLNVHTAANPAGEIRGQVLRELNCSANVPVVEPVIGTQSLSPNPTSGRAELRLQVNEAFDGQLIMTDPGGKVVHVANYSFTVGQQTLPLELGALPAGIYFAQIRSAQNGVVCAFKVVRE